jgi:hypothetical protein
MSRPVSGSLYSIKGFPHRDSICVLSLPINPFNVPVVMQAESPRQIHMRRAAIFINTSLKKEMARGKRGRKSQQFS